MNAITLVEPRVAPPPTVPLRATATLLEHQRYWRNHHQHMLELWLMALVDARDAGADLTAHKDKVAEATQRVNEWDAEIVMSMTREEKKRR